jgi:hypothetical protein
MFRTLWVVVEPTQKVGLTWLLTYFNIFHLTSTYNTYNPLTLPSIHHSSYLISPRTPPPPPPHHHHHQNVHHRPRLGPSLNRAPQRAPRGPTGSRPIPNVPGARRRLLGFDPGVFVAYDYLALVWWEAGEEWEGGEEEGMNK